MTIVVLLPLIFGGLTGLTLALIRRMAPATITSFILFTVGYIIIGKTALPGYSSAALAHGCEIVSSLTGLLLGIVIRINQDKKRGSSPKGRPPNRGSRP